MVSHQDLVSAPLGTTWLYSGSGYWAKIEQNLFKFVWASHDDVGIHGLDNMHHYLKDMGPVTSDGVQEIVLKRFQELGITVPKLIPTAPCSCGAAW